MQFMPATWLQYGVDAQNAGYADPYNPVDAIFAAARYLRAAGAARELPAAILAYNHSAEYVSSVLLRARLISAYPKFVISTLTGLVDARLPVTGTQLAWALSPSARSSSPTGHAAAPSSKAAAVSPSRAKALSSPAPPPTAVAAAATANAGATAGHLQLVDLRSARSASVVAVEDGRITQLGRSRSLGSYVVLRDVFGDVFTYANLGSIARSYVPAKAPSSRADRAASRSSGAGRAHPLRVGSLVAMGTVLGRVRVTAGAKDGHLRFAIRPAGDPNTIDPDPILASWMQLYAALHPQGATGEANLLGATASANASAARVSYSAGSRHGASSPLAMGSTLTATHWEQLIARVAELPTPKVAIEPSSAAIRDPQANASNRGSGSGPLSFGG